MVVNIINKSVPYFLIVLGVVYSPVRWFRRLSFSINKLNKILVVAPYHGIGNLVLLISILKALKKNLPNTKVSVLVGSKVAVELFSQQPYLDEVITFDVKKPNLLKGIQFFRDIILPKRFDLSISTYLGDYFYFSVWPFFAEIPYRIGTYREDQGYFPTNFINTWVMQMDYQKHETEQYLDLIRLLGLNVEKNAPELFVSKVETDFVERYLVEKGINHNELILGVHPGSSHDCSWKRWPLERFLEVTNKFSNIYEAKVLWFVGPAEQDIRRELACLNKKHIIVERLTLKQVVALIGRCQIFLSNDSGLMHIAAAMKVPVVSIFGPTLFERNRPYGDNNILLRKDLPCSPCFKFKPIQCEERKCLDSIKSEEVFQALERQVSCVKTK